MSILFFLGKERFHIFHHSLKSISGLEKIMNNIFISRREMQHLTEKYLSKRYEM